MSNARLSLELTNDRREIPRLAEIVQQFGRAHHLSEDDRYDIQLALDEIVINVIVHGYEEAGDHARHRIHVSLELEGDLVTIQITDDARAYDPRTAPAPRFDLPVQQRRVGGLGVHIVKSIMETIDYARVDGHNVVTMTKRAHPTE